MIDRKIERHLTLYKKADLVCCNVTNMRVIASLCLQLTKQMVLRTGGCAAFHTPSHPFDCPNLPAATHFSKVFYFVLVLAS